MTTRHNRKNANPRGLVAKQLLPYRFAWPQTDAAPSMSTIEVVDPELRDALALWPLLPLTSESLTRRRANALELIGAVPKPNLPDIATDEIHVESAFGAKPIRVLTYRPVTSDEPLPVCARSVWTWQELPNCIPDPTAACLGSARSTGPQVLHA